MEELQKAAIDNGIQDGPQMSRFLLWVGNECFEKREVPDLKVLTARAKQLVKMFLAQDQQKHSPTPKPSVGVKVGAAVSVVVLQEPIPKLPSELALKIARVIKEEYSVGTSSSFCDERGDWDECSEEDLAQLIEKTLSE